MNRVNHRVWVRTALFCDQCNWHELIVAGIRPLINELSLPQGSYRLQFDRTRGQNIRLAFLTGAEQAPDIARKVDRHFSGCLERLHKKGPSPEYEGHIFMPFPENTIHYGLYEVEDDLLGAAVASAIAGLILEDLAEEPIDDAAIMTAALHFQLGILKIFLDLHLIDRRASIQEWLGNVHEWLRMPATERDDLPAADRDLALEMAEEVFCNGEDNYRLLSEQIYDATVAGSLEPDVIGCHGGAYAGVAALVGRSFGLTGLQNSLLLSLAGDALSRLLPGQMTSRASGSRFL